MPNYYWVAMISCDDQCAVYANDWILSTGGPCPGCYDSMGVWSGHRPEECIVTRLGPGCLVTPGTAQTGYRSLSLGTCGQKRISYQLK